jgi:hypothetical protein
MAKPIEPTPIIGGEDAKRFIENMIAEQSHPDQKRVAVIREARKEASDLIKRSNLKV